ncbi:MAG: serine/threonine protein kinase [Quinella sp. 3Q1]|nr:serine/threonine protein kinase [Quinella sp. 3Q1]
MKGNVAEFLEFRFEKLKLLKKSERGEVWLAQTRQSGELVIIKRVLATGLPYGVIKNFSFKLPARIFHCVEDAAETVIVEEFIHGENLHERKKPLSESEARAILLQLCDGLRELHAQNIIHRDIKPSNLILQGGRVRLIDFDAARIFKDGKQADTRLLGTKGYAPPEQYGSGQTDPRSDIYSLGVTMKILLGKNCGEHLKKILDKCTAYDPINRFQSVDELKAALTAEEPRIFIKPLILLTAGIFLFATSPTLNRDENFSEEIAAQVETLPVEKISTPAQITEFKLPEIILPPQKEIALPNAAPKEYKPPPRKIFSEEDLKLPEPPPPASSSAAPINFEPKPRKTFSGLLKTQFYLNGALVNQDAHKNDREKITRADWRQAQARLHVTNDTIAAWQEPSIKIIFTPNWGGDKLEETKTLPALEVGAATDFIIPFDTFELPDKDRLSVCLQIYLDGDESKMDEHYWCVWFDIAD